MLLVENAVNFEKTDDIYKDMCEIVIMGQQIGDDIAIVVKDNGQGIEPNHLEKLKVKLNGEKISEWRLHSEEWYS